MSAQHADPIQQFVQFLYSDLPAENEFETARPKLAHYSSLFVLESMLKNDELWLSNPLVMNDYEEVAFGINASLRAIYQHERLLNSLQTKQRCDLFLASFQSCYDEYGTSEIAELYVGCLSQYDDREPNGKLSMWRAYGADGGGAAIVLDTAKLTSVPQRGLVLAKVVYGTAQERLAWINRLFSSVAEFLRKVEFDDAAVPTLAKEVFKRIVLASIFSKDVGFREEQEWRLAYLKDRDPESQFEKMKSYSISGRGIEPRLKLNMGALSRIFGMDYSYENLADAVILGPTASTPISVMATRKMLQEFKKTTLAKKVRGANIPYRRQ
ncbi:DUF2971 domain-containing protein [Ruegeria atlantica]|uniref:DUF2971 domain-containing protein n=1 Tax=Ruegeria atlantica TaxID=81569 RepID=A0A0P1EH58_9RHOB|nr:DUF2971 domain-containing protein [Ruegeria atlantica]CUH49264.1 hypothetical protein RUA4292_03460 [Ruegeria atlantica]